MEEEKKNKYAGRDAYEDFLTDVSSHFARGGEE